MIWFSTTVSQQLQKEAKGTWRISVVDDTSSRAGNKQVDRKEKEGPKERELAFLQADWEMQVFRRGLNMGKINISRTKAERHER